METKYLFVFSRSILDLDAKIAIINVGSSERATQRFLKVLEYAREHNYFITKYNSTVSELLWQRAQKMFPGHTHAFLLMETPRYKLKEFSDLIFRDVQPAKSSILRRSNNILSLLCRVHPETYFAKMTRKRVVSAFPRTYLSPLPLADVVVGISIVFIAYLLQIIC